MMEKRILNKTYRRLKKLTKPTKEELVAIFEDLKKDLTKWRDKK